ncbi:MAG: GNAT family N-acetyltransferase [Phycisphaerae bacterium]
MRIRTAENKDAVAIADIRERTIRTIVAPLNQYSADEIEAWASNFSAQHVQAFIEQGNYLVAELEGRVVGFGRLQIESATEALVRGVFVDADCVGRGIGSALATELLKLAHTLGIESVELVATLNARSFYERLGFEFLKQIRHATANGAMIPGLHMRRRL